MNTDSELNDRLTREADQFFARGGAPLDIEQVLDRAGEIRRGRRMRATMLMAACVLAVVVPTALVAADRQDTDTPTPARKVEKDLAPLQLGQLEQGRPPRNGYAADDTWHGDTSVELSTMGKVLAVVPLGSRFLVETNTVEGPLRAAVVPTPPEMVGQETSWPVEGGLAISAGGDLAAFVKPDGTPVVVQDEGQVSVDLPRVVRGSGFGVVAVTGTTCKSPSDHVCAVWLTSSGKTPESWVSTPEGATRVDAARGGPDVARRSLWRLTDVLDNGTRAGLTEVTDTGSCSEVQSSEGRALWSTCDHRLLSFSPDGRHVLASSAYADGAGDNRLAVLDAERGQALLELETADSAFIPQMVWEDDTHLLAVVGQGTQAAIVRIGLDGSREYAVPPVTTQPYESPFVLPSR